MSSKLAILIFVQLFLFDSIVLSSTSINGYIFNAAFQKIYLTNRGSAFNGSFKLKVYDSCISDKEGYFNFTLPTINQGQYYSIELSTTKVGWIPILLREGDHVNISAILETKLKITSVSGSKEYSLKRTLDSIREPIILRMNTYADSSVYYRDKNKDTARFYSSMNKLLHDSVTSSELLFVRNHTSSLYSLQLLQNLSSDIEKDSLNKLLLTIDKPLQKLPLFDKLLSFANVVELKLGSVPVDIPTEDSFNHLNVVHFNKYLGKTVLLDFWASWCVPCRKNIPDLKITFSNLDSSKFALVSVSIDAEKDNWKSALKKEEMPWENYLLEYGKQQEFLNLYSLKTIPKYILVNPNGKIALITANFRIIEAKLNN